MLEKHCVFAPTAVLGGLIPPDNGEFRLAVLPPWARITFQNFWTHVRKSVIEYCLDNPRFANGGEPVRLHAILEQHQEDLHKFCDDARAEYQDGHPTEADLWERLFVQLDSREHIQRTRAFRITRVQDSPGIQDHICHTPVRPKIPEEVLYEDLVAVSNHVNARIFDRAGSMYFVFYNGQDKPGAITFPEELATAYAEPTQQVMKTVAEEGHEVMTEKFSLLFDWMRTAFNVGTPPRESSGSVEEDPSLQIDIGILDEINSRNAASQSDVEIDSPEVDRVPHI